MYLSRETISITALKSALLAAGHPAFLPWEILCREAQLFLSTIDCHLLQTKTSYIIEYFYFLLILEFSFVCLFVEL